MVGTILDLAHGDGDHTIITDGVDSDITTLGDLGDGDGLTDGIVGGTLDGVDLDMRTDGADITMATMDHITIDGAMATDSTIITEVEAMP